MAARIIAFVVVAVLAAAAAYYFWPGAPPPPPGPERLEAAAPPPLAQLPKFPVAPPPEAAPLPPLKQSDPAVLGALARAIGGAALERFFHLEQIVHRVVATVDNLPRESYAMRLNPLKPVPGLFAATGSDASLAIAPANDARYADLVAFIEGIDATRSVALYLEFYPLFQQAYVELGYPNGYFNDRLVEVIDHLLAAPELQGTVALAQPHVLYEYADPELEARSAGQKALMRVGPANALRLKAKLRELRRELLAQSAARPAR